MCLLAVARCWEPRTGDSDAFPSLPVFSEYSFFHGHPENLRLESSSAAPDSLSFFLSILRRVRIGPDSCHGRASFGPEVRKIDACSGLGINKFHALRWISVSKRESLCKKEKREGATTGLIYIDIIETYLKILRVPLATL